MEMVCPGSTRDGGLAFARVYCRARLEVNMEFTFTVRATVERTQGKFASRDELEGQIQEALDDANPGDLTGDNGGEYEVTEWDVST